MSVPQEQRLPVLERIADAFLPRWRHMPSAGDVGLCHEPLRRVLALRPDLEDIFWQAVDLAQGHESANALQHLNDQHPAHYQAFRLVLAAAYYSEPRVMAALDYSGQQPQTLPRGTIGAEDSLEAMMAKPARYRPGD